MLKVEGDLIVICEGEMGAAGDVGESMSLIVDTDMRSALRPYRISTRVEVKGRGLE
jgi:hypothetical protein